MLYFLFLCYTVSFYAILSLFMLYLLLLCYTVSFYAILIFLSYTVSFYAILSLFMLHILSLFMLYCLFSCYTLSFRTLYYLKYFFQETLVNVTQHPTKLFTIKLCIHKTALKICLIFISFIW